MLKVMHLMAAKGKPEFDGTKVGTNGEKLTTNPKPDENSGKIENEIYVDVDIMVLANPRNCKLT